MFRIVANIWRRPHSYNVLLDFEIMPQCSSLSAILQDNLTNISKLKLSKISSFSWSSSCEGADIIFPPSIFSFEKPFFALLKLLRQLREAKWEGFRCKFYMNRQEKEKSSIQNRSFRRIVCCLRKNRKGSPAQLFTGQNCPFLGGWFSKSGNMV